MDLFKLAPIAFRLIGQSEKVAKLKDLAMPVYLEWKKVEPELKPLLFDIYDRCKRAFVIGMPLVKAIELALPKMLPILRDLATAVYPQIVAEMSKPVDGGSTLMPFSVRWTQELLNKFGADPQIPADGKMGPATQAAIKQFQKREGIPADGLMGPATYVKLFHKLDALQ